MTEWPKDDVVSMNAFYGNPDADKNGVPDRKWEDANLIAFKPLYPMLIAWDTKATVKSIRLHRKVAESFGRIQAQIINHYGTHEAIEAARMHLYGGAYNFRLQRGAPVPSIHSWGCAIDLDPERNAYRRKYGSVEGMMPMPVVEIFESEGWEWGGRWKTGDAMHFQAART